MQSITQELLNELKSAPDIEAFFKAHENSFINQSTADYLSDLIKIKEISISDIAKNSGVGEYTYKVFEGIRKPSRDILIAIAFGMALSLEEMQLLLRISKFAILDSRDKRDSIIIYSITNGLTVFQADDLLYSQNFSTLN